MNRNNSIIRKILMSPKMKVLSIPLMVTAVLIFVLFTLVVNGANFARNEYEQLVSERIRLRNLEDKLSILQSVQADQLNQSEMTVIALPSNNPSLWMMAQIKTLAATYDISLKDTKIGQQSSGENEDEDDDKDGEVMSASVELTSKGDTSSILSFIQELSTLAPINQVETVFIRSEGDEVVATSKIRIYWSPLPLTLPDVSEPITNLTGEETQLLSSLAKLKRPTFTTSPPSDSGIVRSNPFSR